MSLFEHILIIVLLITISAFFSMSEIALAAARKLRLRQLVAEGEARASKVLELQQHPGNFFTIVQIGLNAVAILGGILGEDTRRVGDRDAALPRRVEINVVDAGAEGGDEPEPRAGLRQQAAVDAVGDGGHQHVGRLHGLDELSGVERAVFDVQPRLEQLHEPRFDRLGQRPGDDHQRFLL